MKRAALIIVISLFVLACTSEKSSNVQVNKWKNYGFVKVDSVDAKNLQDLQQAYANGYDEPFTVSATIEEICKAEGCWIQVQLPNSNSIRVSFKNHFKIPTSTPLNTRVWFHGIPTIDTLSVEDLKHYAEDAGESKEFIEGIKTEEIEYGFEADGIGFLNPKSVKR